MDKGNGKRKHMTQEDLIKFAKTWQGSENMAGFTKALGITPVKAGSIAYKLRKHGIELKRFPRKSNINWKEIKLAVK